LIVTATPSGVKTATGLANGGEYTGGICSVVMAGGSAIGVNTDPGKPGGGSFVKLRSSTARGVAVIMYPATRNTMGLAASAKPLVSVGVKGVDPTIGISVHNPPTTPPWMYSTKMVS
jgi:hypothetical protein